MDGNKTAACLVTVISTHTGIPSPRQAQQPAARVYLDRQILHVDSPAVETLLYRLDKPARETSLTVNRSKGILIVRGSSGWSGKPVM
jgi:acyl dehydratase